MREVHGVIAKVSTDSMSTQQVRVVDREDSISLLHTSVDAALLTAEEARFLARELNRAAIRLEKRTTSMTAK